MSLSHKDQLQLSVRFAVGMRAIIAYDDEDYCGETDSMASYGNAAVCTGRAPFGLDVELGYGVHDKVDLILETHFSIESDFAKTFMTTDDGPHPFRLAPGARFFFADSGRTKVFSTAQLVLDFSGYKDSVDKERGFDVGVRNLNGLWFDIERAYGVYVYAGETLTFKRWLDAGLELGVGISARFF